MHQLGIPKEDIIQVPKDSPASKRYIWIENEVVNGVSVGPGLFDLPTSFRSYLDHPHATELLAPSLGKILSVTDQPHLWDMGSYQAAGRFLQGRKARIVDESLDAFLQKRFPPFVAHYLGTALAHGACAADSRFLSAATAFPELYRLDTFGEGSLAMGAIMRRLVPWAWRRANPAEAARRALQAGDWFDFLKDADAFTFRQGIATLVDALVAHLLECDNVRLRPGVEVEHIGFSPRWNVRVLPSRLPPVR
jgi:hypothetical protein